MRALFLFLGLVFVGPAPGLDFDKKLSLVMRVYETGPKDCTVPKIDELVFLAGKALFESTLLSGDRDTSCQTCHLDRFGSADGLPIAVGVGGDGEGGERYASGHGTLVQRNALSLKGRGNEAFTAFFWDGKVQVEGSRIVTQFGHHADGKFESPLAAAATLPLVERDEFLGETNLLFENEVLAETESKLYFDRYKAVSTALRERLLHDENEEAQELARLLQNVGIDLEALELADIGNILAAFITANFPCVESAWDRYVLGDTNALTEEQKHGAVLFYGKGRCASCHAGPLFSDFLPSSIGAPQGAFGPHSRHRDLGRGAVTHRGEDLFRFRTPPLIGVSETAPYGHNGAFATLREVVVHHFNPLAFYVAHEDYFEADRFVAGKLLAARDPVLATIDLNREEEIKALLEFLSAL